MAKPQKPVHDQKELPSTESEEGFLGRWSRLKSDTGVAGNSLDERPDEQVPVQAGSARGDDIEVKTDADMPPLESLHEDSDYSVFFSTKVSDELRRLALRKLFGSAKFNLRDGLDDYDEDFRSFEVLGDILTSDMRRQVERALEEPADADTGLHADVTDAPEAESLTPVAQEDERDDKVRSDHSGSETNEEGSRDGSVES